MIIRCPKAFPFQAVVLDVTDPIVVLTLDEIEVETSLVVIVVTAAVVVVVVAGIQICHPGAVNE